MRFLAGLLLSIGLLCWPSPLDSGYGPDSGRIIISGGGEDANFLRVVGIPEFVPDSSRGDPVALPVVEPEPLALDETKGMGRPQPTTRGSLRVWTTFYALEDFRRCAYDLPECQPITASGRLLQVGHAATYPVRDATGKIVSARLGIDGLPELPFGAVLVVPELGEVELWDTGMGMDDGRFWLDVAVQTRAEAVERGAEWREIEWRVK